MTSTSFNVGLNDGKKVSSRVLRPPGGGHTDIFGGEPEPPRRGRGRPQAPFGLHEETPTNNVIAQNGTTTNGTHAPVNGDSHPEPATTKSVPQEPTEKSQEPIAQPQEPNAPPQEIVDSPTKVEEPKPVEMVAPKFEPPKRVRVPPGGFSSGLW